MTCHLKLQIRNEIESLNSAWTKNIVWYLTGRLKSAVLKLKSNIQISPVGDGSDILALSIAGESSTLSESILDTLMSVFNDDGIYDRQLVSQKGLSILLMIALCFWLVS